MREPNKMSYPNGELPNIHTMENHNMLSSGMENTDCTTTYKYNEQNQITEIIRPDESVTKRNSQIL